jgi:hypothetical protein
MAVSSTSGCSSHVHLARCCRTTPPDYLVDLLVAFYWEFKAQKHSKRSRGPVGTCWDLLGPVTCRTCWGLLGLWWQTRFCTSPVWRVNGTSEDCKAHWGSSRLEVSTIQEYRSDQWRPLKGDECLSCEAQKIGWWVTHGQIAIMTSP